MATRNTKQTSKAVASKASKILSDGRSSARSKSVAGSALAQTKPGKKKYVTHAWQGRVYAPCLCRIKMEK